MIPFNKPYVTEKEISYIKKAIKIGSISGNGYFTKKCQDFFETKYGFEKTLLTTSCTDALEMAAILIGIKSGDEVIMPSYTFVSTANAFVLRGVKILFADSEDEFPNINVAKIEELITSKTKAIVVVHYAGVACDMDAVMKIAKKYNLYVIEDAAQAIDSYYKNKPLGSIGHLAAFSFHETKNITSGGEGGMLVVNDTRFIEKAEIVWEKGTNRAQFSRGEVGKYEWVDVGSSFLPSEITAAFLFAQLENLKNIQDRRKAIWKRYYDNLQILEKNKKLTLPFVHKNATNNAHMFFLLCSNLKERNSLMKHLKDNGVLSIFHYLPLHKSPFYQGKYEGAELLNCNRYSDSIVRLPLYCDLKNNEIDFICFKVKEYFE